WFWAPFVGRAMGSMVVTYFALGAVLATVNAFKLAIGRAVEGEWFGKGATPRVVGGYAVAALIALGVLNAWLHPFHQVRSLIDLIWGAPVRGEVATARLPRSVGADITDPLVLRKIAASAKAEGGNQLLFINEPESDLPVIAAGC